MGKKKGPNYTPEFKEQAVDLANRIGLNRAAKELGVSRGSMQTWKSKQSQGEIKTEKQASVEEENRRLRKEVDELRKVNQILRKAAAFFSQDQLK